MLFIPKHEGDIDGLVGQLRDATAPTPGLIRQVVSDACTRLPVLESARKSTKVGRLVEAGAWCDAALALIEIGFPPGASAGLYTRMANGSALSRGNLTSRYRSTIPRTPATGYCHSRY